MNPYDPHLTSHERELAQRSAVMQQALLNSHAREYSPEAFWKLQDRLTAWIAAAVLGWIACGFLVWTFFKHCAP